MTKTVAAFQKAQRAGAGGIRYQQESREDHFRAAGRKIHKRSSKPCRNPPLWESIFNCQERGGKPFVRRSAGSKRRVWVNRWSTRYIYPVLFTDGIFLRRADRGKVSSARLPTAAIHKERMETMYQKVSTDLNFVDREKDIEKFWRENDIFKKSMENQIGRAHV